MECTRGRAGTAVGDCSLQMSMECRAGVDISQKKLF